jgi:DNA polymerase II small subunit
MEDKDRVKELLRQGIVPTAENLGQVKEDVSNQESLVEVIKEPTFEPHRITISEFTKANRTKYSAMKTFLMNRPELQNAVSIKRAPQMEDRNTTIIGMIFDIAKLPTGTIKLELEDPSGKMIAIISQKNKELMKKAEWLTHDEVLGFIGGCSKGIFFVKDIVLPDIPQKQIPQTDEDVYVVFSADMHIGSNVFNAASFNNFISWLEGKYGDDSQKEIASKVKYILFAGDIIDGVGVYPNQNKELNIVDIYDQYKELTKYLKRIPSNKQVIISPGTHEGVRIEDPKPHIPQKFIPDLYNMPNVTLVTDPAYVRLHKVGGYPGLNVLMYHGDSYDYYIGTIDALRLAGGYDKGTEVMKYLLKRRSLSPSYGGQEVLPMNEDPLIIYQVPDVMHSGHLHKGDISFYKGVALIASSCFQGKTAFQEKLGHHPDFGKVTLMNLKDTKISMLDFLEEDK